MNIDFYTQHINTLIKIKEMAEKHGYRLSFGVRTPRVDDIPSIRKIVGEKELPLLFSEAIDKDIIEVKSVDSEYGIAWFEITEGDEGRIGKTKIHQLVYSILHVGINIKYFSEMDRDGIISDMLDMMDSYGGYGDHHIGFYKDDTSIRGFETLNHKDYNVYRSGMAVKFFGDLVCDYFGEPRIGGVY